jgi:hypothetical protein
MRRVYVLLAAAVIAATLIAVAGSAGASVAPQQQGPKQYTPSALPYGALAIARSVRNAWDGYGSTKAQAKNNALAKCRRNARTDPIYRGDCQGAVWVHWGWMAIAMDWKGDKKPPYYPAWGSGWGPTQGSAINNAVRVCRKYAGKTPNCSHRGVKQTAPPPSETSQITGGSW